MIHQVILKIASRCNLNCSYCYLYNHQDSSWKEQPKFITDHVFDRTLEVIRDYCRRRTAHQVALVFHGGEPTLVGPGRLASLSARAKLVLGRSLASITLQTNGTRLNEEMVDVIARAGISVGFSLDGPAHIHDATRVTHANLGSYSNAILGLERLRHAGIEPAVLCVVNPYVSGEEIYRHFRDIGLRNITFLLPDVSHDHKLSWYSSASSTPVADYLTPVFDSWFRDDDPDVVVRPFTDLIASMMGGNGEGDIFGNPLQTYVMVETDGSIEALDTLRVCYSGITKTKLNVVEHTFDNIQELNPMLHRMINVGFPLCVKCEQCHERAICGGGYLPHRYSRAREFDNPSVWCEDIKSLLQHMRSAIGLMAT
ncbi:radical SAM protein [Mesorhizobium sp. CA14]|uniref:radical SAM protein n=1 Tax=Mesorhizobium sp. CA14 TaxID=2876642 RepID=UPI001CCE4E9F|nr:radical SAM protein [Mesorhizobium sp. CA14]MBZ9850018.1 radical SAM protein [Mesorhizobium sp. CA14]